MCATRRLPLESLEPYLLEVPHPSYVRPESLALASAPFIDWRTLFGNANPVEIEVGFGKGLFLQTQSQARPATNFLGIEIERKYVLVTATHIARRVAANNGEGAHGALTQPRSQSNVKLACTDARWFLRERVAEHSVAALHVYFPDPWWKTRHRKRKLFTREFAEVCVRVLTVGGRLHFVTDVADYFAESMEMLKDVPALTKLPTPESDGSALTNFERKYRAEGRPIYRALFELIMPGETRLL